ncbi:MAG: sigma-70 family RNA polymerase sigma factor, partial [Actinomycetota bacterium]|nr:sigma-70 family RNA polymerase sigma factor [Actinomycetota bacterium]
MPLSLSDASDGALVVAIGRWREDALAEAYRRHAGAVYGLARRVLVDVTPAEEVVQEVFLRLWTEPEKFDPERGSLRSYLLAQSHGRAVDILRSETS